MKTRIRRFLLISLIALLLICVGVFSWITNYMVRESDVIATSFGEQLSEYGITQFARGLFDGEPRLVGVRKRVDGKDFQPYCPVFAELLDETSVTERIFPADSVFDVHGEKIHAFLRKSVRHRDGISSA